MYNLPHPLLLLKSPLPKEYFKQLVKEKVLDYWSEKLRADAAKLDSLIYFKPQYMSLDTPHPILTTCGANVYEINKAICQLKLLSGRYRSDKLLSHFHPSNSPLCQLGCETPETPGDVQHLLIECSSLKQRRQAIFEYWDTIVAAHPVCADIVQSVRMSSPKLLLQFILDCSVLSPVIAAAQQDKTILLLFFKVTRFSHSE